MTHVEAVYDSAAKAVVYKTDNPAASLAVRSVTSFVKAVLLDAAIAARTTPHVFCIADVACGRGQDLPKLYHTLRALPGKQCSDVYCTDLSIESLKVAQGVADSLFHSRWSLTTPPPVITFTQANVIEDTGVISRVPVHIITCHLALHYWCDTRTHIKTFFDRARQVAESNCVLVTSFADGRWVVRAARDAQSHGHVLPGGVVQVRSGPMTLRIHKQWLAHRLPAPAPFGASYEYQLDGRLGWCTEYLVHEGALCQVAAEAGWTTIALSERMDIFAKDICARNPYFEHMAEAMKVHTDLRSREAKQGALYRAVVFARSAEAAAAFRASLWSHRP